MPLYRQEERFEQEGVPLDRGTMSRWMNILGGTL
ncbi:MAG: transposase, partial [Deltaproteobacteria bacterium]